MQLLSHIAFGLLFGMLFYYFFGFGFDFVLLVGFAAFIPDLDWAMQFKWGMGERHRTFMHNLWAMLITAMIAGFIFKSMILAFGIVIGFITHLMADSFTVTGVSWLYPYGYENKFYIKGPLNMSDENERRTERILQKILFAIAGFLFLIKSVSINLFSMDGFITIGVLIFVGYAIMKNFGKIIQRTIRQFKI